MRFTYVDKKTKTPYEMDLQGILTQLEINGYKGKKKNDLLKSIKDGGTYFNKDYTLYRFE